MSIETSIRTNWLDETWRVSLTTVMRGFWTCVAVKEEPPDLRPPFMYRRWDLGGAAMFRAGRSGTLSEKRPQHSGASENVHACYRSPKRVDALILDSRP